MDVSDQLLVAGRFELHYSHLIGKGAFCRVHSGAFQTGTDRVTKKQVAIKVMLSNHSGQLANEVGLLTKKLKGESKG